MANTPRYSFVQPSPWIPAISAGVSALGGIIQEQNASDRQRQRLKGMANLLGASGYEADAQVYEQMALAETPDYGTAALTGKAVTRDLSMPFEHALKVMEKQRDRDTSLMVAGIRSGGRMSYKEYDMENDLLNKQALYQNELAKSALSEAEKYQMKMASAKTREEYRSHFINYKKAKDVYDGAVRERGNIVKKQKVLLETFKTTSPSSGTTPTGAPKSGLGPGTPTALGGGWGPELPAEKPTGTEEHENTLLPKTDAEGNVVETPAEESVTETPPAFAPDEPQVGSAMSPRTAAMLRERFGRVPSFVQEQMQAPPSTEESAPAATPTSVHEEAVRKFNPQIDFTRRLPSGRYPFVGEGTVLRLPEPERVLAPDKPVIKEAPVAATKDQVAKESSAATDPIEKELQQDPEYQRLNKEFVEEVDLNKKLYNFMADEFDAVKTQRQLEMVVKAARSRKAEFAFKTPEEAQLRGRDARATMGEAAANYDVVVRYNDEAGKYNYSIVRKGTGAHRDANNTVWIIDRGPYAGQIFYYDDEGYVVQRMPDGSTPRFHLYDNPNKDVTKGEFENWIREFNNSPLAAEGIIPRAVNLTSKKARSGLGIEGQTTPPPLSTPAEGTPAPAANTPGGYLDKRAQRKAQQQQGK